LQILWPRMLRMERELELALSSDRRLFLRIVLDDHRTRSLEQAEAFVEDFVSLPINSEMAENMAK
jgi:alpha-galactosidase/6-phospho-beta-glucosidase family protein